MQISSVASSWQVNITAGGRGEAIGGRAEILCNCWRSFFPSLLLLWPGRFFAVRDGEVEQVTVSDGRGRRQCKRSKGRQRCSEVIGGGARRSGR
ncbi:unnamed protein product [Linum trigynum]|uniref:Uncharacterized protein n=1 Tax=Linum trigynum TaxID=586398 RepID=A0AAV2G049_9ROSI